MLFVSGFAQMGDTAETQCDGEDSDDAARFEQRGGLVQDHQRGQGQPEEAWPTRSTKFPACEALHVKQHIELIAVERRAEAVGEEEQQQGDRDEPCQSAGCQPSQGGRICCFLWGVNRHASV